MAYSFLIGNGINRCIKNEYSADNLIKNLDSENNIENREKVLV